MATELVGMSLDTHSKLDCRIAWSYEHRDLTGTSPMRPNQDSFLDAALGGGGMDRQAPQVGRFHRQPDAADHVTVPGAILSHQDGAARGHLVVFEAIAVAGNLEAHAVPEVVAVRFRPDRVQIVAAFVDEQQQAFPARQP